jgi:hypothetical protein
VIRRILTLLAAGVVIVALVGWLPVAAAGGHRYYRHESHHQHNASPARLPMCEGAGPIIPGPACAVPQF